MQLLGSKVKLILLSVCKMFILNAMFNKNTSYLSKSGKELNMVFGFQLSFSRVGSSISFFLMLTIYEFVNRFYQGYVGLSIVILIASTTCVFSLVSAIILSIMDKREEIRSNRVRVIGDDQKIRITDVKNFRLNFWILSLICVMYYLTILPFVSLAQVYFKRKYHMTEADANLVNSCVYIVAAFISPLCGFLVDKVGRNIMWVSLGRRFYLFVPFISPF